jgi:glutamine synthetase
VIGLADVAWHDGSDVLASPRQALRRQLARLAERGWNAGTELEFLVFPDSYEGAWHKGFRGLRPYLALSAIIASRLHGANAGLELEPSLAGSGYADSSHARVPSALAGARELFAASAVARDAVGEEVVEHYLNAADVELAAFEAAVTDWKRVRGFERL